MSGANREGPLVTVGQIRSAIRTRLDTDGWLNYYMADAERADGITEGQITRPRGWQMPSEVSKWPEVQIPTVLIAVAGITAEMGERGEGEYAAPWGVTLAAVCGGVDDDDTWRIASVYGAALLQFTVKQMLQLDGLDVEDAILDRANPLSLDDLPQQASRSLRMASVACVLRITGTVSSVPGVAEVPDPALGDPGPYPDGATVTLNFEPTE